MGETTSKNKQRNSLLLNMFFFDHVDFCKPCSECEIFLAILYPIAAGFYGLQAFGADARGGNDTERVAGNFEGGQLWGGVSCELSTTTWVLFP